MKAALTYIAARLSESGTYAGISGLLIALHVSVSSAQIQLATLVGTVISAVIAIILKEGGQPTLQVVEDAAVAAAPTIEQLIKLVATSSAASVSMPVNIGGTLHNINLNKAVVNGLNSLDAVLADATSQPAVNPPPVTAPQPAPAGA